MDRRDAEALAREALDNVDELARYCQAWTRDLQAFLRQDDGGKTIFAAERLGWGAVTLAQRARQATTQLEAHQLEVEKMRSVLDMCDDVQPKDR